MPDETPEQKAAREAQVAADKATIDRITAGVTAGVNAAIPKITESISAREAESKPAPRTEPATIVRPTEEELAEAVISGNKAEYARLLKLQRAADQQDNARAIGTLSTAGSAAIGSLARQAADRLPHYKRFKAEIDKMVDDYCASSGAVPDYGMYERAHSIVRGNHLDELISETAEETLRKAREPEEPLIPEGRRGSVETEHEPTSLAEALAGDWKREFRVKQREIGGRSDDEELRKMGYGDGLKGFLADRKRVEALEDETKGTFGLDRDWIWTDKSKGDGHWAN